MSPKTPDVSLTDRRNRLPPFLRRFSHSDSASSRLFAKTNRSHQSTLQIRTDVSTLIMEGDSKFCAGSIPPHNTKPLSSKTDLSSATFGEFGHDRTTSSIMSKLTSRYVDDSSKTPRRNSTSDVEKITLQRSSLRTQSPRRLNKRWSTRRHTSGNGVTVRSTT